MKRDLRTEGSYREILQLAGPISLALLVPQINFITTNIFLGHLSEGALARASLAGVYYLVFAAVGSGLNNGLQAIISRRAGERSQRSIGLYFDQGIILALMIAAFAIAFTWLLSSPIFSFLLKDESIARDTAMFLKIRVLGLPFLFIYQLRNALLVGINRSQLLIIGTLGEALANIFFDYALIFGKAGFPAMGFKGAAIAGIISEFSGMFLVFLAVRKVGIQQQFGIFKSFRPRPAVIQHIWKLSLPLMLQHLISLVSWLVFYILVEASGSQSLAISQVMRNVIGFFSIFIWSLGASTNSMVSNLLGQQREKDVMPLVKRILKLSVAMATLVALILNLIPELFMKAFSTDPDFVVQGVPVLRVLSLGMILMSAGAIVLNAVVGTGSAARSLRIEVMAIVAYTAYIFITMRWLNLGLAVGWMSEWIYWSVLLFACLHYLKKGSWASRRI